MSPPQLSVVTTLYRSAAFVREFHERASAEAAKLYADVEFIFVNDGSPDESLDVALAIAASDPRVRIVDLARNFGHHPAMFAGLAYARGKRVFLIDCDLEEPPECLQALHERMANDDHPDVVYGQQSRRKGHRFERVSGGIYYRVVNAFWKGQRIPSNWIIARLMTRRFVDAVLSYPEREVVFNGVMTAVGFHQVGVPVLKKTNPSTTYAIRLKVRMLLLSITGFSDRPLIYIAWLGLFVLVAALVQVAYLIMTFLITRAVPQGYTSLAVSIWLLGGLIIFCQGIVATYLSVIFTEVKHRPRVVVRAIYGGSEANADRELPQPVVVQQRDFA